MQNNPVSIIIINYRQKNYLQECVKSIYENIKSYPFEVIIINNSPEEKLDDILSEHSNLKIIENKNSGFSQANNLGAKNSAGEYLLFLNGDTLVKNDFLEELIQEFRDKSFGAAGLKLLNPDGTSQLSFWRENTFFNEFKNKKAEKYFRQKKQDYINKVSSEFNSVKEAEWVTGAAMFVRRDVFNETGRFDENFFLFYEDADLCKRLQNRGFKIYFFPYSEIFHLKGENVNPDFKKETYYYAKKSQLLYYKKHNNFINRVMLRLYLFIKFEFLALFSGNPVNFRIFKLVIGIRND